MVFDLVKLLTDVFEPERGEVVTVACDVPRPGIGDTAAWRERRTMAAEWWQGFAALGHGRGFTTNPLLTYPATGAHGADLPPAGLVGGSPADIATMLGHSTLAVFLTEFSATAALDGFSRRNPDFRAASMPGVEKRMEQTALAADHREVARRCSILRDLLLDAERLDVSFSSGHRCSFDLRFRRPEVDDGHLPRHKQGDRVINLPSGETFIVPYEGEQLGVPSQTAGTIPHRVGRDLVLFQITNNRITRVDGAGEEARRLRVYFAADPARCNIAEAGFGCNRWAQVTGNVLEDEKAGFHWAYGRSDHLGGTVGVKAFTSPDTVVHTDIVYARGNPIQVVEANAVRGTFRTRIIRNAEYIVF
jgi:hypothetical protein